MNIKGEGRKVRCQLVPWHFHVDKEHPSRWHPGVRVEPITFTQKAHARLTLGKQVLLWAMDEVVLCPCHRYDGTGIQAFFYMLDGVLVEAVSAGTSGTRCLPLGAGALCE